MGAYTLVWVAAISCALIGVGESYPQHRFTRPSYFSFSTVHVPSSEPLKPAQITPIIEAVDSEAQAAGTVEVAPSPVEEKIEPVVDSDPASPTVDEVILVESLAQTDESFVLLEAEPVASELEVVESVDIIPETATEVVDQVYDQEVLLDVTELPETLISQEPEQLYVEEIYEPQVNVQPEIQVVEKVEEIIVEEPKIAKQLIEADVIVEKPVDDMQLVIGEEPQPEIVQETEIVDVQAPQQVQVVSEQQETSSVDPLQTDTFFRYNNFLNSWLKLASVNMKRSDLLKLVHTPGQDQTHYSTNIRQTETVEAPIVQAEIIEPVPEVVEPETTIIENPVALETEVTYVDVPEVIEPSADYDVLAPESVDQVDTIYDSQVETVYDSQVDTIYDSPVETVYDSQVDTIYDSPVETIHDSTADTIYDSPVETVYDSQVDTIYDSPVETIYDSPADTIYDSPVETVYDSQVDTIYDSPVDTIYDSPVEQAVQQNPEPVSEPMPEQFLHPIVEDVQQTLFEVTAETEATLIEENTTPLPMEEEIATEEIPTITEATEQLSKTDTKALPELTPDLIQSNAIAKSISSGLDSQNFVQTQTTAPVKAVKVNKLNPISTFTQSTFIQGQQTPVRQQSPWQQHTFAQAPRQHHTFSQARHHSVAQAPARHQHVAQAPARHHHVAQAPARHHHVAQAPARHHHVAQAPARHHHVAQAPARHHHVAQAPARHHHVAQAPARNQHVAQAPARNQHVAQAPARHQAVARHHTFNHSPSYNRFSYSFAHVPRSFHG